MDNVRPGDDSYSAAHQPRSVTRATFGPDRRLTWCLGVVALVFAGLALAADDAPGRLIYSLAVLVAGLSALGLHRLDPRLVVDADGLRTRSITGRWTVLDWDDVAGVLVEQRARLGVVNHTLEIDDGVNLVVLNRYDLGRDVREVVAVIEALRP